MNEMRGRCTSSLSMRLKPSLRGESWRQGTLLPPVRQVASDLGVNLNTVAFAYRRLQKEGLIRVRHGSGAVVISQTIKEKPNDRLRAQLRTALTQLILAGLKPSEIKTLINEELDELSHTQTPKAQTSLR